MPEKREGCPIRNHYQHPRVPHYSQPHAPLIGIIGDRNWSFGPCMQWTQWWECSHQTVILVPGAVCWSVMRNGILSSLPLAHLRVHFSFPLQAEGDSSCQMGFKPSLLSPECHAPRGPHIVDICSHQGDLTNQEVNVAASHQTIQIKAPQQGHPSQTRPLFKPFWLSVFTCLQVKGSLETDSGVCCLSLTYSLLSA